MQCIIHKYAKTLEDIKRLEKVINLTIKYEDYIEKQREEGKLELAQTIAKVYGIKKAIQLSGFTQKEIETGKLIE